MDAFLALPEHEQRALCDGTGEAMGIEASSIEKDFWICWMLREVISLPGIGQHITFKGGTSLSKGWGLIERFSEDIDLVIDRHFLGIGGDRAPEAVTGTKERKRRVEAVLRACQEFVNDGLRAALRESLAQRLPRSMQWDLLADPDDEERQSLLFRYPTLYTEAGYIPRVVKLELGARSDTDPSESPTVRPYLAEHFEAWIPDATFAVRAVAPVRTFWEKAMLLHEEACREADSAPRPRLARHYYDLWCLIRRGVAEQAAADPDLFHKVAAHRAV